MNKEKKCIEISNCHFTHHQHAHEEIGWFSVMDS